MNYIGPGVEAISFTDVSNKIRANGKISVGDSHVSFPQRMAVHAKLVLAKHEGQTSWRHKRDSGVGNETGDMHDGTELRSSDRHDNDKDDVLQ